MIKNNYHKNIRLRQLNNFIKKISCMFIILLGLFTVAMNINVVFAAEVNVEEIVFTTDANNITSVESDNFTATFNSTNSSASNGIIISNGNIITITPKDANIVISKIEVVGDTGVLNNFHVPNGIVDYTLSTVEYIDSASSSTLNALNDVNVKSIKVTYEDKNSISEYVVFNLLYGSILFSNDDMNELYEYSGYDLSGVKITGSYSATQKFYILQAELDENNNYIRYNLPIDNNNISYDDKVVCDMTIDNLWCSYVNGNNGGIHIPSSSDTTCKNVLVRLKGTNRFSRISYWTMNSGVKSSLKFTSYLGDGDTAGNLIVVGKQTTKTNSVHGTLSLNGWNSAIGGCDSSDRVYGLEFLGGTILAVATARDQCTAIGAGGNGYANIKIKGGSVTAISYTTGTAIGGGIGHLSAGGPADITISGGVVNAYNLGQPYKFTCSSAASQAYNFVPGTAIGGGSSYESSGNTGTVTITGGIVNAYSNGGSGLGGGNSIKSTGGIATIKIDGGEVTSYGYVPDEETIKITTILNSLQTEILNYVTNGGTIQANTIEPFDYGSSGSGIGGGSGRDKNGGSATINISGGYLDASSIGGGNSVNANGADATVIVTGGTTKCGTIGGGFSEKNGYADGTVTVTGGSLDATMSAIPTNGVSDEMLYLTRVSVLDENDQKLTHTVIPELICTGLDSSIYTNGNYGCHEMYTDDDGMLYLWLPGGSGITEGKTKIDNVEKIIKPWEDADGVISAYEIGILKISDNGLYNHYVNTVSCEYYTLYSNYDSNNKILANEIENTTIVANNTLFTIYIAVNGDYTLNTYYAVELSSGKKTFQKAVISQIDTNLLYTAITITQNTTIVFEVIGENDTPHFFILDLYDGDVNVREDETGLIIEQNGYELTGYNGGLYVTSGGIATSNVIDINIDEESSVDLFLNNLIIGSDESCISIHSGTVNLTTGSNNDIIHSNYNETIFVDEHATLNITTGKDDALKLYTGADGVSPISGKGKVVFNNNGGYFDINVSPGTPQFSVGIYEFSGKNAFTAELYIDQFEFDLIGYIDENDKLHDVSVSLEGNTDNFAARGVYKVLTSVKSNSSGDYVNAEGNFITTLQIDSANADAILGAIELMCGDKTLVLDTDYFIEYADNHKSCTLTILGSAFVAGNIMIFAAAEGEIPFQIISFDGVYDGNSHTITLAINSDKFTVYYSDTVELNSENYKNELISSTTCPTYTNVTLDSNGSSSYVTVYVYIVDKITDDDLDYVSVASSGTVRITKGTNVWNTNLTCSDIPYDENQLVKPKPNATAKWGTVKYIIYDSEGNELTNPIYEKGKTYQVRAYVEADPHGNYDYIQTDYTIKFKVVDVKTFTSDTRTLSKAQGIELSIDITLNGSFSVLYNITYSANLELVIYNNYESELPSLTEGTKITFIDFATDGSKIAKYYYYIVKSGDNVIVDNISSVTIPLTNFIEMGTEGKKFVAPDDTREVQYQFCIDFPDTRKAEGEIRLSLQDANSSEYQVVNIKPLSNKEENIVVIDDYDEDVDTTAVTFDLTITADDTEKDKVLAVELLTTDLTGLELVLYNGNDILIPQYSTGNQYFFKLANSGSDIRGGKYQLVINNYDQKEKSVDVVFDVRNIDTLVPYILTNNTSNNHKVIQNIKFTGYQHAQIMVDAVNDSQRVVTEDNSTIEFTIVTNDDVVDYNELSIKLYKKNNDVYTEIEDLTMTNNTISISNSYENGTYRLVFEYKDTSYNYNIIIYRD